MSMDRVIQKARFTWSEDAYSGAQFDQPLSSISDKYAA
jgi:hypothetical protein